MQCLFESHRLLEEFTKTLCFKQLAGKRGCSTELYEMLNTETKKGIISFLQLNFTCNQSVGKCQ